MNILGISCFYHDSAAAILVDGEIVAAAHEERFSRKKHDPDFPASAISYCLEEAGLTVDQLDVVVFYDKPLLKFERLLDTYYSFSPRGLASFIAAMPVWLREKMFLKKIIHEELRKLGNYDRKKMKLLFPEHHLSHAASAFFVSPFTDAAILTIDGVGEWATASIGHGDGNSIKVLKELHFPHSLGLLYSAVTYYCGFKVNSGEYKLMGLAPYGNLTSGNVDRMKKIITTHLVELKDDGSIFLNQTFFTYATGLRMANDKKWKEIFGFERRSAESPIAQQHCDLAMAIQQITEEVVIKLATEAKKITGSKNLCLAGGVALNCVANGKLQNSRIFENIYIQPAAGDAGGALGAALAAHHIAFGNERRPAQGQDSMKGALLGPAFSDKEILKMAKRYRAKFQTCATSNETCTKTAEILSEGNVVGWFQGRMEFGPRALGARSILADPRNPEMQKVLNLKIKFREGFRPFAPSVLSEKVDQYFELNTSSPYMLLVQGVKNSRRKSPPPGYDELPLMEKLYFQRSDLPAITHIDYSARIQTVHKETNEIYHTLISEFEKQTGCAVLINTSFNVRGEPLVCTPEDAYRCFMRTAMDYLVVGNYIFKRDEQPEWKETGDWKQEFELD